MQHQSPCPGELVDQKVRQLVEQFDFAGNNGSKHAVLAMSYLICANNWADNRGGNWGGADVQERT
jgi:hypothetical protein